MKSKILKVVKTPNMSLSLLIIYIAFLNTPFFNKIYLQLFILLAVVVFLLLKNYNKKISDNKHIYMIIFLSLFVMYIFFSLLIAIFDQGLNPDFLKNSYIDLAVYVLCLLMIVTVRNENKNLINAIKFVTFFTNIYVIFVYFQALFPQLYENYIIQLFSTTDQPEILQLHLKNFYSGITNQTAHTAGYILLGIFSILSTRNTSIKTTKQNVLLVLYLIALLFTGKRAHLIFGLVAILITLFISSSNSRKSKFVTMTILTLTLFTLLTFIFGQFYPHTTNLFIRQFVSIYNTFFPQEGTDSTSGRLILFEAAFKYFLDNPLFGNGWRYFYNNSQGILIAQQRSNVHNMYLQLLSDVGLLGFILYITYILIALKETIVGLMNNKHDVSRSTLLKLSLMIQIFYLLYGMTGNILSDYNYFVMHTFAIIIIISCKYNSNSINLSKLAIRMERITTQ